jgi:hypothetical protein
MRWRSAIRGSLLGATARFLLFNIESHTWHPFRCTSACDGGTRHGVPPGEDIGYDIGKDWLEFVVQTLGSCGANVDEYTCGPIVDSFYNLRTGKIITPALNRRDVTVDLDTPVLLHKVCKPVTVPAGATVTAEGAFAIVSTSNTTTLERCGSRLHRLLKWGVAAVSSRAVIWALPRRSAGKSNRYAGIYLPSLKRFSFNLPAGIHDAWDFALDNEKVYFADGRGRLWAARLPTAS